MSAARRRLREDWYLVECRPYRRGVLVTEPEYVERDNNHGFALGDGSPAEKAAAWARDLTWDWCDRTRHPPGRWDVRLWRLDDTGRHRIREMAHETVHWPESQQPRRQTTHR